MNKIVIASDSFKETISSKEISDIFEDVFKKNRPDIKVTKVVLGDGGENTLDVFSSYFPQGKYHYVNVNNPNFNIIKAKYFTYDDIAVIELAEAAGLVLANKKEAKSTTTFGVGELILDAYDKGFRKFYIALGGSATNDGGCGLLSALGIKFTNQDNKEFVPVGETISDIIDIDDSGLLVKDAHFTILSDVKNPMFGEKGAAYVFAKQKGANDEDIKLLDNNLRYLNKLIVKHTGKHIENIEGTGAAGATSAGMLAFLNAEIVSGIDIILSIIDFKTVIKGADYVVTGEGRLDNQSFDGKLISGVLIASKEMGVPTICICGTSQIKNIKETDFYKIYETSNEEGLDYKNTVRSSLLMPCSLC